MRLPPRQLIPKWMFSVSRAVPLFCLVAPSLSLLPSPLHCIVISSYPFSFSRLCWPGSGYSACPCPSLTPRRSSAKAITLLVIVDGAKVAAGVGVGIGNGDGDGGGVEFSLISA